MKVAPQNPQPGDVLTVTIFPASGETISAIGMRAFDTAQLQFSLKSDGTARAFVGFPFDRSGGTQKMTARVQTNRGEQILNFNLAAKSRNFPTQRIVMRNQATAKKMSQTGALRAEKVYVQSKMKKSSPGPLWSGNWVMPAKGTPSSPYGRKRYINGKWWGQHNGSDLKAPSGRQVVAMNSGKVVLSEYLATLRGNCVVIDHGCNVFSLYLHLSKRQVAVGQNVGKGQNIGLVGSTGFSTGAHLHFEVRVGWEPVDPYRVLARGIAF